MAEREREELKGRKQTGPSPAPSPQTERPQVEPEPTKEFTEASAPTGMDEGTLKRAREANPLNLSAAREIREQQEGSPGYPALSEIDKPPVSNYEARKAAYMRRVRGEAERTQERESGPTPEHE
jgi:hypothetical protein